ncbi:MAG: BMP family ABC transporter substrate-binding protein [Sphaerochaetaceae bacterium]|nr:BMP family ABC transporter substrate-binding protein [Sphaerochaetaceae bacterium]
MKKTIVSILVLCIVFCSVFAAGNTEKVEAKYELALVTDANSIDDRGFNQGAWEGIEAYAIENNISHQYYRPIEQSTDGYLVAIETAVNNGAKLIVCPGFLFETAIFKAQTMFPEVAFILLDGVPNNNYTEYKTEKNTYSIVFAEDQAGFLAGYSAVMEGYRNLGFFGAMAVPAVVRYGYGFVQGADYAGEELGLNSGDILCKYMYTGTFDNLPENQTKAASWYQSGVQCIFQCGVLDNVFAACESVGGDKMAIGVDLDQSANSEKVLTSSMKMLSKAVEDGISMFYAGNFPGGVNATLTINDDSVGLPMETSRFKNFTQENYELICSKMVNDVDGIISNMIRDTDASGKSIPLQIVKEAEKIVKVEEIK